MLYFPLIFFSTWHGLSPARLPLSLPQMVVTLLCLSIVNNPFLMVSNVISQFLSTSLSLLSPMQYLDFNISLQPRAQNFPGSNLPKFSFPLVPISIDSPNLTFNSTSLCFSKSFVKDLIIFLHVLGKQTCSCSFAST